jgi:hypothetical protein
MSIKEKVMRNAKIMTALLLCAITAGPAFAQRTPQGGGKKGVKGNLASYVPADISLYAEVRGLPDVIDRLKSSEFITRIRELHPHRGRHEAKLAEWRHNISKMLNMTPEEAISAFAGKRFAIAVRHDAPDHGAVISIVEDEAAWTKMLEATEAVQQEERGDVAVYSVNKGKTLLARSGNLAVAGSGINRSMFDAVLARVLGEEKGGLAGEKDYRKMIGELPNDRFGTAFIRPAEIIKYKGQPKNRLEKLLLSVPAASASLSYTEDGFKLVVSGGIEESLLKKLPDFKGPANLAELVPEGAFMTGWSRHDLANRLAEAQEKIAAAGESGRPPKTPFIGAYLGLRALMPERDVVAWAKETLGDEMMVVGLSIPGSAAKPQQDYEVPGLALAIETEKPANLIAVMDQSVSTAIVVANLGLAKKDHQRVLKIEKYEKDGKNISYVRLQPLLTLKKDIPFLHTVEVCWGEVDGQVVVASSRAAFNAIAEASKRSAAPSGSVALSAVGFDSERPPLASIGMDAESAASMLRTWQTFVSEQDEARPGIPRRKIARGLEKILNVLGTLRSAGASLDLRKDTVLLTVVINEK